MKRSPRAPHRSFSIRYSPGRVAADVDDSAVAPQQLYRRHSETADIIFGVEPVRELIAVAPSRVRILYVKAGTEHRFEPQMRAVRESGGQALVVMGKELVRLAGLVARHQGIVAALHDYSYLSVEDLMTRKPDPLLLIDGITDPRNLGAILRIAECAGVGALMLARDHTVGITSAAIKSSAGAWAHLEVARCGNVVRTLDFLKNEGYWVVALDPQGDTSLYDLDVSRPLTLILGSEGRGIRDIVCKSADFIVRIPLHGRVSSLNVSIAAAVALFEIAHRRADSQSTLNP
jgi:23S rRNA (guanosine2251-2'-O)-methyltransferase